MLLKSRSFLLKFYLLLAAIESTIAFYSIASIPSDPKNAIFLGYSLSRFVLLSVAGINLAFFGSILIYIHTSRSFFEKSMTAVNDICFNDTKRPLVVFPALGLMVLGVILFIFPLELSGQLAVQAERLAPLIHMGSAIGFQTLIGQFIWREQRIHWNNIVRWKRHYYFVGGGLALLGGLSAWIVWTGIGLVPERSGWNFPGTPYLFAQLVGAWLLGLLFFLGEGFLERRLKTIQKGRRFFINLDLAIFSALWLTALLVWWGEPMRKDGYFTPSPTPPNFEYYPYSDASFYDQTAQGILIGEGENNKIVLRPLYIFFLALLHALGGQQYNNVIFFQILFLAFMPAFAFLAATMLGNRAAGIMTAVIVILRERNAIALTDIIEVTHSKLLLSDVPTMALIVLSIYALIRWLKRPDNLHYLGVVAGALFGLVVLVRSQAQLLLPVFLVGIIFSGGFHWRRVMQRVLFFGLGVVIVVAPWIWRNYQVSGHAVVENTEFYIRLFAGGYSEPTDRIDILPGESFDEYNDRIKSQIVRYIINHPVEVARVYASYFLHDEISSIIYFPMSPRLYDLRSYVSRMPFWTERLITFNLVSGLFFFFYLGVIILGLGVAVQRTGFVAWMPLFIHLGYSFSIVPARISGWRYILPVDWIPQLYFSVGLIELTFVVISLIWNKLPESVIHEKTDQQFLKGIGHAGGKTLFALAIFSVLGLSLPFVESSIPRRYPALNDRELVQIYAEEEIVLNDGGKVSVSDIESFLAVEADSVVLHGRALYPAYYVQGKFWGDDSPNLIEASQYDRLQFNLIGPDRLFVYIPLQEAPRSFPNASDVFIAGCMHEHGVQAMLIKVNGNWLVSSPFHGLTCTSLE